METAHDVCGVTSKKGLFCCVIYVRIAMLCYAMIKGQRNEAFKIKWLTMEKGPHSGRARWGRKIG